MLDESSAGQTCVGGAHHADRCQQRQDGFQINIELGKETPCLGVLLQQDLSDGENSQHDQRDIIGEPGRMAVREMDQQAEMAEQRDVDPESQEQRGEKCGQKDTCGENPRRSDAVDQA